MNGAANITIITIMEYPGHIVLNAHLVSLESLIESSTYNQNQKTTCSRNEICYSNMVSYLLYIQWIYLPVCGE